MAKPTKSLLMTAAMVGIAVCVGQAAHGVDVPGVTIELAVCTADGSPRIFESEHLGTIPWDTDLPTPKGDRVLIKVKVTIGDAKLRELRIRLDNKVLSSDADNPSHVREDTEELEWQIEVDTGELDTGHHLIEAWAATERPDRYKSVTTSFLLVPSSGEEEDPLLRMLRRRADVDRWWREHPLPEMTITEDENLACAIRSLDPKVDEDLQKTSSATVTGPVFFRISAGPAAKEFVYAISRDGVVTYASTEYLPLLTHIRLAPPTADAPGLEPGELILTAWAGDGTHCFGQKAQVTVQIKGEEAEK